MADKIISDAAQAAVAAWVQRELQNQPWWRQKSNTITTAVGALGTAAAYVGTNAAGLPVWATSIIAAIGAVATVLGVANTKNGVTVTTGAQLQAAAQDPLVLNAVIRQITDTLGAEANKIIPTVEGADNESGRHRRGD